MPKPKRNKAKIQDEEEGGHLEIVEGASNTQKSLGNTRRNQKTGLSYRRPSRDYSKSFKWSRDMNKEIYHMYVRSEPTKKGYQKRLKAIWDERFPIHVTSCSASEQHKKK